MVSQHSINHTIKCAQDPLLKEIKSLKQEIERYKKRETIYEECRAFYGDWIGHLVYLEKGKLARETEQKLKAIDDE